MSALSPWPACAAFIAAWATAWALTPRGASTTTGTRVTTIDGLRGYLALAVFLHHGCVWVFYLRGGGWQLPASALYDHFGGSSVALFFMITAFLFWSKLLDARTRPINWARLYLSRIARLTPLYIVVVLLLLVVVAVASSWRVLVPWPRLVLEVGAWLAFTIPGPVTINALPHTDAIVAGVTWSLPYEWCFYLLLPLMAIALGQRPPRWSIALSLVSIVVFAVVWMPDPRYLLQFMGGVIAAGLSRSAACRRLATHPLVTLLMAVCLLGLLWVPTADVRAVVLLTIAFSCIACGNSVGGLLVSPASRTLGDMAYSIYLVHGLLLFVTFRWWLGPANAAAFSPAAHWALIVGGTPVLVLLCRASFLAIERPAMVWVASRR